MTATHAVTLSGEITFEVLDPQYAKPEDEIRHYIDIMDGREDFSIILWRVPEGMYFDEAAASQKYPEEYIQAAGSQSRMAAEIRKYINGELRQFTVGRPGREELQGRVEIVTWGSHELTVRGNEVFVASEVGEIFAHYYNHGDIPSGYSLRELEL
jgi:hypothetical protein